MAASETDPAQDPGQQIDPGAEQGPDPVADSAGLDPDAVADPAAPADTDDSVAEGADPAAAIGSIHPRLDMHGPHGGPTGDRRLPVLGSVPYAGPTEPDSGRSRLIPVLAVVAAGGLAAGWGGGLVVRRREDHPDHRAGVPRRRRHHHPVRPPRPDDYERPIHIGCSDHVRCSVPVHRSATSAAPDPSPAPAPAPTPSNIALMEPAAWFSGGRMVLVGALPDRGIADAFQRKAAEIVGADAVVDHFTIDPNAPTPAGLPVAVAEQVRFDLSSSEVSAARVALVKAWKEILDANPGVKMHNTGFTDSTGPMAYNLELSRERAQAVAGWMQARGVPADRFAVDGRGPADPVADNATDAGRATNRRIQVTLEGLLVV